MAPLTGRPLPRSAGLLQTCQILPERFGPLTQSSSGTGVSKRFSIEQPYMQVSLDPNWQITYTHIKAWQCDAADLMMQQRLLRLLQLMTMTLIHLLLLLQLHSMPAYSAYPCQISKFLDPSVRLVVCCTSAYYAGHWASFDIILDSLHNVKYLRLCMMAHSAPVLVCLAIHDVIDSL